jgi:hypothetical protein
MPTRNAVEKFISMSFLSSCRLKTLDTEGEKLYYRSRLKILKMFFT